MSEDERTGPKTSLMFTSARPQMVVPEKKASLLDRIIRRSPQPKTSFNNAAVTSGSNFLMVNQTAGRVAPSNSATYRAWSTNSEWVRAAIDIRRDQVSSADWDIVPYRLGASGGVPRYSKRMRDDIRELFDSPNLVTDSFHTFIKKIVEDLLVLDAGVIEKVRNPGGTIAELWPSAADFVRVDAKWDGSDPDSPRYFWYPDGNERASFKNSDMVYMMQNPRTISAVGVSPLEILKVSIDSEMQTTEYNRRQVMGAAPDGVLNIGEDANPENVEEARSYWEANVYGKGAMGIIGGFKAPDFIKFRDTNREMQFQEWQDYLVRKIAVVYGLAPMDLGITFDVNRSTADKQGQDSEDRGLRPLMALIQEYLTREIVWDKSFGGRDNNLAFRFTALNLKETKAKADINKLALGGTSWKTMNEARIDDGREPLGKVGAEDNIFDHILINTAKGIFDVTIGEYIGAEQFADAAAGAQIDVEEAKGDIAADNADTMAEAAAKARPPAPKGATSGGSSTKG